MLTPTTQLMEIHPSYKLLGIRGLFLIVAHVP